MLLVVAGCGGGEEEPDANVSPMPAITAAPAPTGAAADGPSPERLARRLLNDRIAPWRRYLTYEWGGKPESAWSVLEEAPGRWLAQVQLSGDARDERITAEWVLYLPLNAPTTIESMPPADLDGAIEPEDEEAERLDKLPPALPGNEAELTGSIETDGRVFALDPDVTSARSSERARRGTEAIGGADRSASTVRVRPNAATRIVGANGKPITVNRLRTLADDPLTPPTQVVVVWKLGREVRTEDDLAGTPPWSIRVQRIPKTP